MYSFLYVAPFDFKPWYFNWIKVSIRKYYQKKTRAVLGFRSFGFRGVWNMLSFGMVLLDMSWLVFMYVS